MPQLSGQVALITGAGSGVGRATAVALAARGANVVLTGRTLANLRETTSQVEAQSPGQAHVLPGDVSDPEQVQALMQEILARFGKLDILVNNAGVNVPRRSLAELAWADWQRIIEVNLNGCYLCVQAVLPIMRRQQSGTLVHVGSNAARRPSPLPGAAYTAAKAGLAALSAVINAEERVHGIRSAVITLGDVNTPLLDHRPQPPPPAARAMALQPEDVAACVELIVTLPPRATIEEIVLVPTTQA